MMQGLAGPHAFAKEDTDWAATAEASDRQLISKPKDSALWADLVESRLNLGDVRRANEALNIWRHNVPKAPKTFPVIERLQGDLAYSQHDLKGAVSAWQLYVRLAPKVVEGWNRLGGALEEQGNMKEAIDAVSHALRVKSDADHYAWRARLKILLRDWDGAAADVRDGNKVDASNEAVQKLFPIFERSAEWRPKLKELDKAVEKWAKDPSGVDALLDRTELLADQGFLDVAYQDADAAFRRAPKSLRAQLWKGLLAWERGGPRSEVGDVAETSRERLTGINPKWRTVVRQIDKEGDLELRSHRLLELEQPVLAFQQVDGIDGSAAKVYALAKLEQLPKAEAAARRAVEVHPNAAGAWYSLAWIEFEIGNVKETLAHLDRCSELNPGGDYSALRKEAQKGLGTK